MQLVLSPLWFYSSQSGCLLTKPNSLLPAGGSASTDKSNGQGGYSYVAHGLVVRQVVEASSIGQGSVIIIPAVEGCGCNYLCAALDEHRQKVQCICPTGWVLKGDSVSCYCK